MLLSFFDYLAFASDNAASCTVFVSVDEVSLAWEPAA